MKRVFLKTGRAKPFWYGHPWVFSEAIAQVEGSPDINEVVALCDDKGNLIGQGFFNPRSQIRVRLLLSSGETFVPHEFFLGRLQNAFQKRRALLSLPNNETNAFRLVNSEGDGLSGLTVDYFDGVLSVQFTSASLRSFADAIYDALTSIVKPRAIIEMASPATQALEGFSVMPGVRRGSLPSSEITFRENGILYQINAAEGQKTGFFCDQRNNRASTATFCHGKRVLDLYCFVGGFGLNALRRGASSVTFVDASQKALALTKKNLSLNSFDGTLIEADAFRFLETQQERFDVAVVDPPKFAQRTKDKSNALIGYRKLNALALKTIQAGGILVSCSCSGLVSEDEFIRVLGESAFDAKRSISVLSVSGAGGDHPIRLPWVEGRYLKCAIAVVE